MQFRVGNEVEVFCVVRMWGVEVGGWVSATILEVYGSEVEVETRTRLQINRKKMRVESSNVRPQPPPEKENDRILEEGQVIEIRLFDLWITGKVWEVLHGIAETKNVSFSVDTYWLDQRIYSVSMSQVRVPRQWVEGKWVPLPRLPLHHEVLVVPSIKSGDSSAGLRDHSSEQWRSKGKASLQLEDPQFSIGSEVEVYEDFMDGWKHATVKELQGDQIRVQYKVWSWIEHSEHEIDKFYDVSQARLLPPNIRDEKITFNLHQEVEVYDDHFDAYGGFWCRGVILEIRRDMFDSCFYSIGRLKLGIINVKETSLRVRREWVNGQWVQPESYLYVEQPLKQRKMDEAPSIRNEVEVYSLYHRGWIPATILGSVGNKIEVEAWMKKYNETKMWRLYLDVSRMRPRPSMNKDNNWIFRENESVEVLEVNGCWQKGEIWEVHGTGKNLFYSIKAMCEDCIKLYTVSKTEVRVRRKWVGGKWSSSSFEQVSTNDGKGVQASSSKGDHHEEDEFVDTSGEGREFTISAIKEGDTKVGPTLINAHSMLVDGQEKSVEIVIKQGTEVEGISQAPEGYKIPANVAYTFDLICTRYGDIFRNCNVEENLRKLWTIELCGVVHQMEATTYESISEDMINKWYEVCLGHKELKIDNEWLMNRIGEVKEVVKARMDVLELKNSEKKIIDEIIKIDVECEQLLCKRRKLIEEVRSYERKMKTMTKCHVLGRK